MHSKWKIYNFCDKALTNHEQSNILHHWEAGVPSCSLANVYNILFPLWKQHAVSHPSFPFVYSILLFLILLAEPCVFNTCPVSWTLNIIIISVALIAWAVTTSAYIAGVLSFSREALQLCYQEDGQMNSWNQLKFSDLWTMIPHASETVLEGEGKFQKRESAFCFLHLDDIWPCLS